MAERIKTVEVSISYRRATVTVKDGNIPPQVLMRDARLIEAARDAAKDYAREQGIVYGEIDHDLIAQSRVARSVMTKTSS